MPKPTEPVRVRFAPSPTGRNHIGGARTALYNYLLARQTSGQFILRIEDTDRKRYDPQAEPELTSSLHWLGLTWDEGPDVGGPHAPYRQSERKVIYQEHADRLIKMGFAYPCFCTPERLEGLRREQQRRGEATRYDVHCRNIPASEAESRRQSGEAFVVRFKMPREGEITVRDSLRGEITYENNNLDDYILVKSDGLALYHLAAMVDDHLMAITHVIRTSEWLPTFPLHVHIYQAFGWKQPVWIHPSIFLKPSGKGKMSKRDQALLQEDGHSIYIQDLKDMGYLPEAVVNWIALMGWSYDDRTEFFTMEDLIEKFSLERLNPAPAAINFSKLDHFNGLHIRNLAPKELARRIKPYFERAGLTADEKTLQEIAPLIQERLVTLDQGPENFAFFFSDQVSPVPVDLVGKKMTVEMTRQALSRASALIENLPSLDTVTAEAPFRELAASLGLKAGQLFGVIRVAATGQTVSPPLFETLHIIGRKTVLERLARAQKILESPPTEDL